MITDNPISTTYKRALASVYGNLGITFFHAGQNQKAEDTWNKAIHIAGDFSKEDPAAWQEIYALLQYNYGELYNSTGRHKEAKAAFKKALLISTKIGRMNWVEMIKESLKKL